MRINQKLALASDLSRREADAAIEAGRVSVNGRPAIVGQEVGDSDKLHLDGQAMTPRQLRYIVLHKPVGFIVSRNAQGNGRSVFELLDATYQDLQYVGRLDKDSSGLLLFTNDGPWMFELTHPSSEKDKFYEISLDKDVTTRHKQQLLIGIELDDGPSRFQSLSGSGKRWQLTLTEGRNRQIRRTFDALGYTVRRLHRTRFGKLELGSLAVGQSKPISPKDVL